MMIQQEHNHLLVEVPRPLDIGDLELAQLHLDWCGSVMDLSQNSRTSIKRNIVHKVLQWSKVTVDVPQVDVVDRIVEEITQVPKIVEQQVVVQKIVEFVVDLPQVQIVNEIVEVPVQRHIQVPMDTTQQKIVEIPQVEFVQRIVAHTDDPKVTDLLAEESDACLARELKHEHEQLKQELAVEASDFDDEAKLEGWYKPGLAPKEAPKAPPKGALADDPKVTELLAEESDAGLARELKHEHEQLKQVPIITIQQKIVEIQQMEMVH
eukprot:2777194-Heterocapsa_arctica.AAC.1